MKIMGNNKNDSQETVTVSTNDPQKIEELQTKLAEKDKEIQEIKEKTITAIKKIKEDSNEIKTDLRANIIKQNTFKQSFRNGYADGTVEEATKKLNAESRKALVAK